MHAYKLSRNSIIEQLVDDNDINKVHHVKVPHPQGHLGMINVVLAKEVDVIKNVRVIKDHDEKEVVELVNDRGSVVEDGADKECWNLNLEVVGPVMNRRQPEVCQGHPRLHVPERS